MPVLAVGKNPLFQGCIVGKIISEFPVNTFGATVMG